MSRYAVVAVMSRMDGGRLGPVIEVQSIIKFLDAESREAAIQRMVDHELDDEIGDGWDKMSADAEEIAP